MSPRFVLYRSRLNPGRCWVRDEVYGRAIFHGNEAACTTYCASLNQDKAP